MDYETFAFEKVSIAEAIIALKGDEAPPQQGVNWEAKRCVELPSDKKLLDATSEWMMALPVEVRPLYLARKYPRIANRIASVWQRPVNCDKVFDDLMLDHRGTRQGFSFEVAKEVTELRSYYNTVVCVEKQDAWTLTI